MTAPVASGWSGLPGGIHTHWKAPPFHGARAWRTPSDTSQEATTNRGNDCCVDHRLRREVLRQAIYKAMADNRVDALAYPTIRRKANLIGEAQQGTNCQFASNSGLPAIVVPGMFTSDGVPVA